MFTPTLRVYFWRIELRDLCKSGLRMITVVLIIQREVNIFCFKGSLYWLLRMLYYLIAQFLERKNFCNLKVSRQVMMVSIGQKSVIVADSLLLMFR